MTQTFRNKIDSRWKQETRFIYGHISVLGLYIAGTIFLRNDGGDLPLNFRAYYNICSSFQMFFSIRYV